MIVMNMKLHLVVDANKMQNLGMIASVTGMTNLNPQSFSVRSTPHVKEEEKEAKQLDDDIEDLLDGSSFDSIMDSDSEEEEDEVNDLLAKV
jgi:hypothetical protein